MISENIEHLKKEIGAICARLNRNPQEIKIVAVTKTVATDKIEEAVRNGIEIIGENRIQEAESKYGQITLPVKWHFIGHLQKNKVKKSIRMFDLIQSVDSIELAEEIDRQSGAINKIQEVLLEIKISPEPTKYGVAPQDLISFLTAAGQFKNIKIKGLMAIAPLFDDPEKTRPYFRQMRELCDKVKSDNIAGEEMEILSLGMTDDYKIAIEEGANMIRVGRAIFGER